MSRLPADVTAGRREVSIHIGGIAASADPTIVHTVLGSCIAVCLRDPITGIGGMNHFMLPDGTDTGGSCRFGVHAMELLINDCMRLGADRRRLEAKVFGGGHVLHIKGHSANVPNQNIRFALEFLDVELIPVVAKDVGGTSARSVFFFTDSGRILLKKLSDQSEIAVIDRIERQRKQVLVEAAKPAPRVELPEIEEDPNITLF